MKEQITLQETLELLKGKKPSELSHYTELVSRALIDGSPWHYENKGNQMSTTCVCRGIITNASESITWCYSAEVDTHVVDVEVSIGTDGYKILAETKDGKYRKTSDDCKSYVLYDILHELAKEIPVDDRTKFQVDPENMKAVVAAMDNLRKVLKDTHTHLVSYGEKLLVVPDKVQWKDKDELYTFVPTDFYKPVNGLDIGTSGYNEGLAYVEDE